MYSPTSRPSIQPPLTPPAATPLLSPNGPVMMPRARSAPAALPAVQHLQPAAAKARKPAQKER
jgi:hypothetical protein